MPKIIIITGGSGYIGSAISHIALESGYRVFNIDIHMPIGKHVNHQNYMWFQFNLVDNPLLPDKEGHLLVETLKRCTYGDPVDGFIHMAAYKDLTESYNDPCTYYKNNLFSTIHSLEIAHYLNAKTFIFSSSAAVYPDEVSGAIKETQVTTAPSPYGYTKHVAERIIEDTCRQYGMSSFSLRYCNPMGGIKGVTEDTCTSMFGNILNSLRSGNKFIIFGNDYPTEDGTCIRDYIDIQDIADAHLHFINICTNRLSNKRSTVHDIVNVGTGKGISCLEICKIVAKEHPSFEYEFGPRREGDAPGSYADTEKLNNKWSFETKISLDQSIRQLLELV